MITPTVIFKSLLLGLLMIFNYFTTDTKLITNKNYFVEDLEAYEKFSQAYCLEDKRIDINGMIARVVFTFDSGELAKLADEYEVDRAKMSALIEARHKQWFTPVKMDLDIKPYTKD